MTGHFGCKVPCTASISWAGTTHTTNTHTTHTMNTQAASGYLCTYVTTLYLWTQNHKQEAFTDTHQSTHRSQGHRCKCLVKAEHVLFDYNIAHHSWRRFYRFSVCAKLSYATDSRHTLAQTIHSPHEAWALLLSFVRCSAVQDRATVKTLKTIRSAHRVQRRSYFVFEAILRRPLRLEDNLSDTMTNGDLCGVHRCLSGSSLRKAKKMAAYINVSERNTLPVLPIYK